MGLLFDEGAGRLFLNYFAAMFLLILFSDVIKRYQGIFQEKFSESSLDLIFPLSFLTKNLQNTFYNKIAAGHIIPWVLKVQWIA